LSQRWQALRDDLRHYDNGLVMEALANAVKGRRRLKFSPRGLIGGLTLWAENKASFFSAFGAEEVIG